MLSTNSIANICLLWSKQRCLEFSRVLLAGALSVKRSSSHDYEQYCGLIVVYRAKNSESATVPCKAIERVVSFLLFLTLVGTAANRSTAQIIGPTAYSTHLTRAVDWRGRTARLHMVGSAMFMPAGLWNSHVPAAERTSNRSATTELNGCLTIGDGSMPKLILFRSRKTYRLQPRANLQKDDPLVFAPFNANTLVHVTGHIAPFVDAYDPDHSSVFIVDNLERLAPTCNVTVPLAQLRQERSEPATAPAPTASSSAGTSVVKMTGELLVFEPPTITIKAGQTVLWKNSSREVHTVTADPHKATNAEDVELPKGAKPFDSGYLNPGQAYTHCSEHLAHTAISVLSMKCSI